MTDNYFPYEEMGFGQPVPQPKSTYDKVWSFAFGTAGGVATAAWYTGYATSAIALGPLSVPMALGTGVACFGYAVYSSVSESKSLTTSDKMVLVGGSVGAASMSLGAVGFIVPKVAFGMTAVTGPFAVPLIIGGAVAYGIAYHYDTNHKLDDAKPAFYGFAGGALPTTYLCLKSNAEEILTAYQANKMIGGYMPFVESYHSAEDIVLKEHGVFMNGRTFCEAVHKLISKPNTLKLGNGFVVAGEEFATPYNYAAYINKYARDTFEREGRQSWAAAANNAAGHLADEGDASVDLLAGVNEDPAGIF